MLDIPGGVIDFSPSWESSQVGSRQGGVAAWAPGDWQLVSLVADFAPILILTFTRSGKPATWFIDASSGAHLGDTVAGLEVPVRDGLAGRLSQLLAAGFAAFLDGRDEEVRRILAAVLALDRRIRADLLALVTFPSLPQLFGVDLDQPDFRGIEIATAGVSALSAAQLAVPLAADVRDIYVQACRSGRLVFSSPIDGAPCDEVRGFCLGTLLIAYRVRDARHGLTFWVLVAGHHQMISGLLFPESGWLVRPDAQGRQNLVQTRVAPLQALFDHWKTYLPELSGWLARPVQRFATYGWPAGAAHLGHYVWNELPGLEYAASVLRQGELPLLYEPVPNSANNFFGPVEAIFPEFTGQVWRGCASLETMLRHAYGAGIQLLRFSGNHVSVALQGRIEAAMADGSGVAAARETAARMLAANPLVVVFGLRVENRTLVDQAGFFRRLMQQLHAAHPDLVVVVDGHNLRGDGSFFGSFLEFEASRPPIEAERDILAALSTEAERLGVTLVDCVGRPMAENLLWLRQADCFVAPWGAGLTKYSWVAGLPGFCLSNAHNRRYKNDLDIYSSPAFMEAPPEILFSEPEEVIDRPEAPQLIPLTIAGVAPYYANYEIADEALFARIGAFIDRIRRTRKQRPPPVSLAALPVVGDVLRGGEGHLFLASGGHRVIEHAAGWRRPNPASITAFADNLHRRAAAAAALGCPWLHVVYPDKQTVLEELFPVPRPRSLGAEYLARLPDLAPHILFPRAQLRALGEAAYMRKDTHLTDLGSLAVVAEMVGRLSGGDHAARLAELRARITHRGPGFNDLGMKLDPPESSEELFIRPDWPMHHFTNHGVLNGGNNGTVHIIIAPRALSPQRLLLFGDSFLHASIGLLAVFYREIMFLRTPHFYPEIAQAFRPHAMVTANVERYFSGVVSDEARDSFMLVPTLNGLAYQPEKEFAAAFSAMLSVGRPPYRKFLDRVLLGLK